MRLKVITFLVVSILLSSVPVIFANYDCGPSATGGTSANGKYKVELTLESFTFSEWNENEKKFDEKAKGVIECPGHHVTTFIPDSGTHFVLHDGYAGLAIFTNDGKLVKQWNADDLLIEKEREQRPGRWACHPEGTWSEGKVEFSKDSKTIGVKVYSGRVVKISMEKGEIVKE